MRPVSNLAFLRAHVLAFHESLPPVKRRKDKKHSNNILCFYRKNSKATTILLCAAQIKASD
jgi:hypothetical protein